MPTRSDDVRLWWTRHFGLVRLRQVGDQLRHRFSFIPTLYVLGSVAVTQFFLSIDGRLTDVELPSWLETTVPSARSVFGAIAGGLITSITLLLSMMLITVQLASSQFSPRTLRDWLGNRRLQHAVGFVLGTTVFCLLALRSTRDFGENEAPIIPHVTVVVAVFLGVLSLVAVVQAVDHITNSLRVEAVAERLTNETIAVIRRAQERGTTDAPQIGPESGAVADGILTVPTGALAVLAPQTGWLQQVDESVLLDELPDGTTAYLAARAGSFVVEHSAMLWIAPAPSDPDQLSQTLLEAFAIGDTRTTQQDIEFGIIQLTDIAVRALSPGINDPSTACEIIAHHGAVMTALWNGVLPSNTVRSGSKTLVQQRLGVRDLLSRAINPILHYGADDAQTTVALEQMLLSLRAEVERRQLPGPIEPIDELLAEVSETVRRARLGVPAAG